MRGLQTGPDDVQGRKVVALPLGITIPDPIVSGECRGSEKYGETGH